jgi:hypothetical protein
MKHKFNLSRHVLDMYRRKLWTPIGSEVNKCSCTSMNVLHWSKMVVLIAISTYIEIWISIDLHVKWFN